MVVKEKKIEVEDKNRKKKRNKYTMMKIMCNVGLSTLEPDFFGKQIKKEL